MAQYNTYNHVEKIKTKDTKRYLWWLPLLVAVSPIIGIKIYEATGNPLFPWLTPILWYIFIPLGDFVFGRDDANYRDSRSEEIENDVFYKWLVFLSVPLFYVTWIYSAWWIATVANSTTA